MTDSASRESVNAKMNDLIRRASGYVVEDEGGVRGDAAPAPSDVAGEADGGEGGGRDAGPLDMNAELRRATGRPGIVDEDGRAWA